MKRGTWYLIVATGICITVIFLPLSTGETQTTKTQEELRSEVYNINDLPLLKVCPDFYPNAQIQDSNNNPKTKILPKTSSEITSNYVGTTPPRLPRTEASDVQPFKRVHLIDGNPDTLWMNRGQAKANIQPEWVRIDLPYEMPIKQVTIWPIKPVWGGWPGDIRLKVSRDGLNWNTVYEATEQARLQKYEPVNFVFEAQPVKQVMVTVKNLRQVTLGAAEGAVPLGYGFCIGEIEVIDVSNRNVALMSNGGGVTVSSTNYGYGDKRSMHDKLWGIHYDLGVKHIKIAYWDSTLNWHYLEREKGVYTVDARTDEIITETVNNGIEVYMTLCYGNWLYTKRGKPPMGNRFWQFPFQKPPVPQTDEQIEAYLNYCRFVVNHFKGRIRYYEIWNEQNIGYSWPPNQIDSFCKLVKAATKAIKEVNPDAKVMLGGVCFLDVDYFEEMFKRGVAEVVDVICWHPYQWEIAPEESYQPLYAKKPVDPYKSYRERVAAIKKLAYQYGFKGNEFHANETTWVSPYPAPGPELGVPGGPVTEMLKAKYIARTIALHSDMGIPVYYNETWNAGIVYWDCSLLRATFSADPESPVWPQPAYYVLKNMATITNGVKPGKTEMKVENLDLPYETCSLTLPDSSLLLGVWLTQRAVDDCQPHRANLVIQNFKATNVTGIDTINGTEEILRFEIKGGDTFIPDLLITDYPIMIKIEHK